MILSAADSLVFDGQSDYSGVAFLATRVWLPLSSAPSKREGPSVLGSAIYQHHSNDGFCTCRMILGRKYRNLCCFFPSDLL